jgi:hypothetical protein
LSIFVKMGISPQFRMWENGRARRELLILQPRGGRSCRSSAEARIAGLEDFMLVEAPGGTGGWYDFTGPSANSCMNITGFDSACAEAITSNASHTWTWVGHVSDLEAVLADDYSGLQHIGAQLESDGHRRGWNVSISNPIPEPSVALVFGVGIAFAATRVRRNDHLS